MRLIFSVFLCLLLVSGALFLFLKGDFEGEVTSIEKKSNISVKKIQEGKPPSTSSRNRADFIEEKTHNQGAIQPIYDLTNISPEVSLIGALHGQSDGLGVRLRAVRDLPDDLNQDEIVGLLDFLSKPFEGEENRLLAYNALRNNVLGALIYQKRVDARIAESMEAMFYDDAQDLGWKDYLV